MRRGLDYLLEHPALFLLHYFPEKIEKLEDFHLEIIETAKTEPRSLTLFPAGHGKTTIVSTLMPIWALCVDPNCRIAIIAKNEVDARGIMRAIHSELLSNEQLIKDFGPFHAPDDDTKAWSIERIDVAKKTKRTKEGSIQIYGSKGNVLGKRFDWVICDDVVTEKNSSTPEQRQGMREWFNLGVETMPEFPWSRLTVIGTLFDPEDLYHDLRELTLPDTGESVYKTAYKDAIVDEENKITLWPVRWTWERLMAQKAKMGTLDFNKRYRNIAVDKSRIIFHEEFVRGGYIGKEKYPGCLDDAYSIGDYEPSWRRIAGFDPAMGVTKAAKFCAHIILGLGSCINHERCFWIIDIERDQLTLPQQADILIEKHQQYDLFSTVIEVNAYQMGLEQLVQQKCADLGIIMRTDPHHTTKTNKPDPETGVSGMGKMVENGWLHIPWSDQHSRRKMQPFIDELVQYPGGRTTDMVMALWFAWKLAQESAPKFRSFNRLTEPTPTTWGRRTSRRSVKNPYYAPSEG